MEIPNVEHRAMEEPDVERFRRAHAMQESSPAAAIEELKDLASRGSILSMLVLGDIYKLGKITEPDLAAAEKYYRLAADSGSLLGYYFLGRIFLRQKRYDDALSTFSYAAGKGYPPAMHYLGRIYWNGVGVSKDGDRAKRYLEEAAGRGSVAAKAMLGAILLEERAGFPQLLRGVWLRSTAFAAFIFVMLSEGQQSDRLR